MKWEREKVSTRLHHGDDPLRGLVKHISEVCEEASSISLHSHRSRVAPQAPAPPRLKLIINQRNPGGLSKRNNGEVSGQEARAMCQGWRAVLSDYACTKLDKVCVRLVTAPVARVRGEVKRLL